MARLAQAVGLHRAERWAACARSVPFLMAVSAPQEIPLARLHRCDLPLAQCTRPCRPCAPAARRGTRRLALWRRDRPRLLVDDGRVAERHRRPLHLRADPTRESGRRADAGGNCQAAARLGVWGTLKRMVADDFACRAAERRLRRLWDARGPRRRSADRAVIRSVMRLARQEVALAQQARMLDTTHAVFRYWHVFHRPAALAAHVAVL